MNTEHTDFSKRFAESCRVVSEYWALIADGQSVKPLQCMFLGIGDGKWRDFCDRELLNPEDWLYRWKPEVVKHPGGEYPRPCQTVEEVRNAPGAHYAGICSDGIAAYPASGRAPEFIEKMVGLGLVHTSREAALQHSHVMLGRG